MKIGKFGIVAVLLSAWIGGAVAYFQDDDYDDYYDDDYYSKFENDDPGINTNTVAPGEVGSELP